MRSSELNLCNPMLLECDAIKNDLSERQKIFPYDQDISDDDVVQYLEDLWNLGLVHLYVKNKAPYIKIVNFTRHQHPHKNEKASDIPSLTEDDFIPYTERSLNQYFQYQSYQYAMNRNSEASIGALFEKSATSGAAWTAIAQELN